MAPNSRYKESSQMREGALNTALLQPETNCSLEKVNNILSNREDWKTALTLKNIMKPCNKLCSKYFTVPTLSICYPPIYNYQIINNWYQLSTPLFVPSIPTVIPNMGTIFTSNSCPYTNSLLQSMVSPIIKTYIPEDYLSYNNECYRYEQSYCEANVSIYEPTYYSTDVIVTKEDTNIVCNELEKDESRRNYPLEFYLALPREFFPPPRTLTLDPNPIIDEFCKLANTELHTPWLLDLEFGIPRSPITRPIPTYSVKFNSIHCKNTPEAIHPGFETCEPGFKRVLLFYYDCIVSAWYKGYVVMNYDKSIENFQSWLLMPMQVLGMCWP